MTNLSGEDAFIGRWFAPIAGAGGLGLRDDAALYAPPPDCELVVTMDTIVAGVHFFPDDPPATIARKALRVNLSDLAAKGASPAGFLLSLAMPGADSPVRSEAWMSAFSGALGEDAARYLCPLLGGDSVGTPGPLTISITAFGTVPAGRMTPRTGARAGDVLLVSGTLGDAALGLHLLQEPAPAWRSVLSREACAHLVARYREPQPRLALAEAVRDCASGAMDVSDGLAGDLAKMMKVSGVAGRVELARLPLSDAARAALAAEPALLETIVGGGDDYEILCSAAPEQARELCARAAAAGVRMSRIGVVAASSAPGAAFIDAGGAEVSFARPSWSHF